MEKLHIVELRSKNVKRLKAVAVTMDGGPVVVAGNNGQGKSSLLDSILYVLQGKKSLPDQPVTAGKHRAEVDLTLSDGRRVRARINADRTMTLEVRDPQGNKLPRPAEVLDALTAGGLALDPLAFELASDKERAKILREIVDRDGRISALDGEYRALYETRREIGVTARQTQAAADASAVDYDCPEPVDVSAAVSELDAARRHNASVDEAGRAVEAAVQRGRERAARLAEMRSEHEELTRRLALLTERITAEEQEIDTARATYHALRAGHEGMETIDTAPIEARIRDAEQINARVRAWQDAQRLAAVADAERMRYDEATERLDEIRAEQQAILAASDLSVPGLGWEPERELVLLDGVPYSQASQAEKLRAAVGIAVARGPELRVAIVRDGSRLDRQSLRLLCEECIRQGVQVLVEVVGDDHPDATLIIEDGEVRP